MEELHNDPETDIWNTSFEVSSVSRSDLVAAGFSSEFVAGLTDEQMARIAAKMGDYYTNQGYWANLTTATEYIFEITPSDNTEGQQAEQP